MGAEHDTLSAYSSMLVICNLAVKLCSPTVLVLRPLCLHESQSIGGARVCLHNEPTFPAKLDKP